MEVIKRFKFNNDFIGRYVELIRTTVIPYQEKVLGDSLPGVEKSHAIDNFRAAARLLQTGKNDEPFYGMVFQDSDVAKWLEGAAYTLQLKPDADLAGRCDEVIDLIGQAQQADGYLNTFFTVKEPGRAWTNLAEAHELYCAGHMIEAAVAYATCTGKEKLLHIMCRMADHIYQHFITEGHPGYSGHPEIELALMRLYRYTKEERYLELCRHFIDVRGGSPNFFQEEAKLRDWKVWGNDCNDFEYTQSHSPVREQIKATGHAVRAVYLYTGMADLAAQTGDSELKEACCRLWDNITKQRMYITGGIGSSHEGEQFTKDYHLPNDSAYAETCAAIGLIFFARKMFDLDKNSKYADIMELALYNCVLAGMQLDGTRFFYVNPLEVIPGISGEAAGQRHCLPQRPKWFACACCPPNVARLLPSLAQYAWSVEGSKVYSHLYIGGTFDLSVGADCKAAEDTKGFDGKITVETEYPHDGRVTYTFHPNTDVMHVTLYIRIPAYSDTFTVVRNGVTVAYTIENGYACIKGPFEEESIVVLLDMRVKRLYANENIASCTGKVALMRGPLVYCTEGVDNDENVVGLYLDCAAEPEVIRSSELGGIIKIATAGYRAEHIKSLYSLQRPKLIACRVMMIPYYAWANRGLTQMRVWNGIMQA